jgi:HEAT repeat protein
MKIGILFLILFSTCFPAIAEDERETSLAEDRKQTLQFGIDSEILPVLESITEEKDPSFTEEVTTLFEESLNTQVKIACLKYFQALEVELGTQHALDILNNYENRNTELVIAAIDYLGPLGNENAFKIMQDIVKETDEGKVLRASIRNLSKAKAENTADILIEKYKSGMIGTELKAEILLAFGRLQSKETVPLLVEIVSDDIEEPILRRFACTALGEIGDPSSLPVLREAYASTDPLLRNYALHAIGMIDAPETSSLLMQALRDSYYKIRITAAEALGERKENAAVPILVYKTEKDPEIDVRIAAVQALGKIGNAEGLEKVKNFATDETAHLTIRLTAIEILIENHLDKSKAVIKELLAAEWDKPDSRILEHVCKLLSFTEAKGLSELFEMMLGHPAVTVRIHGLRGIKKNRIFSLKDKVKRMSEESTTASVRKHALSTLEALE